jgi:nucleoside-diphosphate-sugar epimerase
MKRTHVVFGAAGGLGSAIVRKQLLDAHQAGSVRAVIPRFPNMYGPNVTSHLSLPIFREALSGMAATWPGKPDVPHDLV